MTDKKQINNEDLEKVTGGFDGIKEHLPGVVLKRIKAYDTESYYGKIVIVMKSIGDEYVWAIGRLITSYYKSFGCDERMMYEVEVYEFSKIDNLLDAGGNPVVTSNKRYHFFASEVFLSEFEYKQL